MTEAAVETEMPPEAREELERIATMTKRGFDPRARLKGRGLRKATITLFLDEETGLELGDAYDILGEFRQPVGRHRSGIVGEIDAAQEKRTVMLADFDTALKEARAKSDPEIVAATEQVQSESLAEVDAEIAELDAKRAELIEKLKSSGITISMKAVPPVIQKDCRRKARETLKIVEKGIPADQQDEFNEAYTAHLMAAMFQSVTDNETGDVNIETTYDDALAYRELLPPGQWDRLDAKLGEVQFTDAISRSIESQEDFS